MLVGVRRSGGEIKDVSAAENQLNFAGINPLDWFKLVHTVEPINEIFVGWWFRNHDDAPMEYKS